MKKLNDVSSAVRVVVSGADVSQLDQAEDNLVNGLTTVTQMQEHYALWMCHTFTVLASNAKGRDEYELSDYAEGLDVAIHWFNFTASQAVGKLIKARRDGFVAKLESILDPKTGIRKYSTNNIDKIWSRIKELSGNNSKSKQVNADKSCDTLTFKELATILRRIQKAELSKEYMPKSSKAHTAFETAYELMGGKLTDVYKSEE